MMQPQATVTGPSPLLEALLQYTSAKDATLFLTRRNLTPRALKALAVEVGVRTAQSRHGTIARIVNKATANRGVYRTPVED